MNCQHELRREALKTNVIQCTVVSMYTPSEKYSIGAKGTNTDAINQRLNGGFKMRADSRIQEAWQLGTFRKFYELLFRDEDVFSRLVRV
mmetsp:Transcript_26975/g.44813  ORF Transcript_26975/g.44813 Transcript_26975/m.44813 type:complete len:89 (-) Transcript_26975:649-915(-)